MKRGVRRGRRQELSLSVFRLKMVRKEAGVRRKEQVFGDIRGKVKAFFEGIESKNERQARYGCAGNV